MSNNLSSSQYWNWFEAFYLFDLGQSEKLAALISQSSIPLLLRNSIALRITYASHPNNNRIGQLKTDPETRLHVLIQTYDELVSLDVLAKKRLDEVTYDLFAETDIHKALIQRRNKLIKDQADKLHIGKKAMSIALDNFLKILCEWPYLTHVWSSKDYKSKSL